jgi:hypothetical protein
MYLILEDDERSVAGIRAGSRASGVHDVSRGEATEFFGELLLELKADVWRAAECV